MASISPPISPTVSSSAEVLNQATLVSDNTLKAKPEPVKSSLACRVAKVFGAALLIGAAGFIAGNVFSREGGSYADNPSLYHWPVQKGYCTAPLKYSDAKYNFERWSAKELDDTCLEHIKQAFGTKTTTEIKQDYTQLDSLFQGTIDKRGKGKTLDFLLKHHEALSSQAINDAFKKICSRGFSIDEDLFQALWNTGQIVTVLNVLPNVADSNQGECMRILLSHRTITPDLVNDALDLATVFDSIEVVKVVLADSRVDSQGIAKALFYRRLDPQIENLLKADDRYDPNASPDYNSGFNGHNFNFGNVFGSRCRVTLPKDLPKGLNNIHKRFQQVADVLDKHQRCDSIKDASQQRIAAALLDVNKNASEREVKKAYRIAAKALHPDKPGCKGKYSEEKCTKWFEMLAQAQEGLVS